MQHDVPTELISILYDTTSFVDHPVQLVCHFVLVVSWQVAVQFDFLLLASLAWLAFFDTLEVPS